MQELKERFEKIQLLHNNLIQLKKIKEFSVREFVDAYKQLGFALNEYNCLSRQMKEN